MHFPLYQFSISQTIDGTCSLLLLPETTSILSFSLGIVGWQLNCSSVTEGCLSKYWLAFLWGLFRPEFQNLLFCALRRRPCRCRYITIVFRCCCRSFYPSFCRLSPFLLSYVACRNFTLRAPFSFLIYLYWKTVNLFVLTTLWVLKFS